MPASTYARRQTVEVPFSEAAMFHRIAGQTLEAVEEDLYYNGNTVPENERRGCYVSTEVGASRIPLLKSEAGWKD